MAPARAGSNGKERVEAAGEYQCIPVGCGEMYSGTKCFLALLARPKPAKQWRWPKMFRLALLHGISNTPNYASN